MSACFYPIKRFQDSKSIKIERFRFVKDVLIKNLLSKTDVDNILKKILLEFNFTVIGYESFEDKYWCKKLGKSKCDLHFEIQVIHIDYEKSVIKIIPLVGTNNEIQKFVNEFKDYLQLYQTSSFMKHYLENFVYV